MRGLKLFAACAAFLASTPTHALILLGSNSAEDNTTAPTGTLANSGFELQGLWVGFQGTPIGPHHFITAAHVGGSAGQPFVFQGLSYSTIAGTKDPNSDLMIWEVSETFPTFAPLYSGPNEAGANLVVVGRGAIKGNAVTVDGVLKGWSWGLWDQRMRWGRNVVSSLTKEAGQPAGDLPHYLVATFDANGTADEAHLGVGDSGGAVFIQQSGVWRLAAINSGVDGPFNTTDTGDGFGAGIFDVGGLYEKGANNTWQIIPDVGTPQPSAFYATRIKARADWISGVLATRTLPVVFGAAAVTGPFAAETPASMDPNTKTIRIAIGSGKHFYQLQYPNPLTIVNTHLEGTTLVIQYQ